MSPRWAAIATLSLLASASAELRWTPVPEPPGDNYKLSLPIEADPEWPLDGKVVIQFDAGSNGAHYAAELEALKVRFVKVAGDGTRTVLAETIDHPPIAAAPVKLTLDRERWRMRLIGNDEVWLTAFDDTLPLGALAVGSDSPKLTVGEAAFQATEPVWFTDDFMRETETLGEWQALSGTWAMSGVSEADAQPKKRPDPNLSSNPFAFRAADARSPAVAATGLWFWDTYRAEVSVRAAGEGAIGLAFYLQDPGNYLALRWQHAGHGRERQLVAMRDGRLQTLAAADGGWAHDQWYRLSVECVDQHVIARIDGQQVFELDTSLFGQGKVGLLAEGVTFADFDDVVVEHTEDVVDSFGQRTVARWASLAGQWTGDARAEGHLDPGLRTASGGGEDISLTGSPSWSDYRVTAVGQAAEGGGLGVVACYQNPQDYLLLRWGDSAAPGSYRNALQLVRQKGGQEQILGQVQSGFRRNYWHSLSIESARGFIRCRVGDVPVFEWFDETLQGGKVGLLAANRTVVFDQFAVEFVPPPEKIEFTAQFTREDTMRDWAQAAGSWQVAEAPSRGGVIWHHGEFWGDSRMTLDAGLFGGPARTIRMVLAGTRPDGPQRAVPQNEGSGEMAPEMEGASGAPTAGADGYSVVLVQTKDNSKQLVGDIQVGGQSVRRASFDAGDAEQIAFVKRGRFALVYVDERCVLGYLDPSPHPAAGLHAAIQSKGPALDLERVDARAEQLFDTTFVKAPWEWYVSKGVWETINRWKCDPRWSFFGGYNDLNPLIWSKDDYEGDVQVEAYMAVKMDLPGPPYYSHPSDLCVTIGGDGTDVRSGYAFLFAAKNNTCSQLYRHGKLLAENNGPDAKFKHVGPQGEGLTEFHRHWFHLVIRKAGGRVTCSVDGKQLFDVPDDDTVPRGKVALWSVNNGLMVARVKVWYEGRAPRTPFPDIGQLQAAAKPGPTEGDPYANDFNTGIGPVKVAEARQGVLLDRKSGGPDGSSCLEATNLQPGGPFAVRLTDQAFKLAERKRLKLAYKLEPGTRVNLYIKARGRWHALTLTGQPDLDSGGPPLGSAEGVAADGLWHKLDFDLAGAFAKAYPNQADLQVEAIEIGLKETDPYLHAGFGCNGFGTRYWLDNYALVP